ncbi:sugar transferase [Klebsiella pneumoniae]|uniref:sugar transferase n=1 Tax=Klebsiella pneumoniae TaxID=573 RepID=UPI000D74082D|nr:sugar transferase [Klebsiella pneumoniae]PXH25490.1 sugar transferase [Klebsiella pneumoniae]HBY8128007.1 sugar transferase [Klebsiella pneumoniae]
MFRMRYFDILISLFMIIVSLPVFLLISIAIISSGQNPIFVHSRIGLNGKEFKCLKFRSMKNIDSLSKADLDRIANEIASVGKVKNDPRITLVGGFIRKTSIDELPQLFNVLIGDMTLVGPRPITAEEITAYGKHANSYLLIKPGLTGLWQVSGRSNTSYRRRVAIDLYYSKNKSRMLKMYIFLKTILVVIKMEGAQ